MGILHKLGEIVDDAKSEYAKNVKIDFEEVLIRGNCDKETSIIGLSGYDEFISYLLREGYREKVQFVYINPPFFTKAKYAANFKLKDSRGQSKKIDMFAYDDRWGRNVETYIKDMTKGLLMIRDLLKDEGVIAIHLDKHASHYARLILDEVFGEENFINEIIWQYKSGGTNKNSFASKHDNILVYGKTKKHKFNVIKEKSYNRRMQQYGFKNVEEFKDEIGWYTMVNAKDVWQINMVGRTSSERTGYATQKPQALTNRLIKAFTDEGDIVADFFSGSGTTLGSALNLNRLCFCCDVNPMAISFNLSKTVGSDMPFKFVKNCKENYEVGDLKVYKDICEEGDIISLSSYEPVLDQSKFTSENYDFIKNMAKDNPEKLINFVSFDFDYDGVVHREDFSMKKIKEEILDCVKFSKQYGGKSNSKIHILAMDIFGGFSKTELVEKR